VSLLRAREAFTAMVDGVPASVSAGEVIDASDPVAKGRAGLFEEVTASEASRGRVKVTNPPSPAPRTRTRTEQATAAPGELRDVHPVDKK